MTLAINGQLATSVRTLTPWSGPWTAEVVFDLDALPDVPTGRVVISIGSMTLAGTIDPRRSGRIGSIATVHVIGGGGGWQKHIKPRHYKNDAGVLSTLVLTTTAAEIGESVVDVVPTRFGVDFARVEDLPASQVLEGRDWYVDASGTTIAGPRAQVPAPSLEVLHWDAGQMLATIAGGVDELVTPGTVLTDDRFGSAIVRDVEQSWTATGATARAWCVPTGDTSGVGAGTLLTASIGAIARAETGAAHLRSYRYTVVKQGADGRFDLRPLSRGAPPARLIALAPAIPGMDVKVAPGAVCEVEFAEGSPSRPRVVRFESGTALEIRFGELASPVALADVVVQAFAAVAANAGLTSPAMTAALQPILPMIAAKKFFVE